MALLSPGIQLFESSVTPAITVAAAENGVATLGFSTRGPVNKLTRIRSISEFNEVFGEPVKDQPFAHIMAQAVLANNTDVYFMRIATVDAAKAKCPVVADFSITGAKVAVRDNISTTTSGYFMADWGGESDPNDGTVLHIVVAEQQGENDPVAINTVNVGMTYNTIAGSTGKKLFVSIPQVIQKLNENQSQLVFTESGVVGATTAEANIGILIFAKNQTAYNSTDNKKLTVSVEVGYLDSGNVYHAYTEEVANVPTPVLSGSFGGETMSQQSSLATFNPAQQSWFNIVAKNPGASMNGVKVIKTTVPSSVNPANDTWTVTVTDEDGTVLESRGGIKPANFIEEMTKFYYIEIEDASLYGSAWNWLDGTWVLGEGQLLSDGSTWTYDYTGYVVVEGTDGYPTINIGGNEQYDENQAVKLYLDALGSDEFINTEENSFSILATPGMQNTLVQNAAIGVCSFRKDAIYLADVPRTLCESKQLIDDVVEWANGNSGFQSCFCAIYYGWFYQTNPYDTNNSIACPASCFIAPKMVSLDQSVGEFYAPAGVARGNLICSDWTYSPDQRDRDKLVGNDNVVNPISYSNTRGVTVMAQKTTDRTTSPLNRVGTRRMTNMINRNLRSQLAALLFEPNNEIARARARSIVDDVLASLRSKECIESYDINVVSGTGANRNDLNVYLSFAPFGLIEKIYVYLSITDAGVEITETVA